MSVSVAAFECANEPMSEYHWTGYKVLQFQSRGSHERIIGALQSEA